MVACFKRLRLFQADESMDSVLLDGDDDDEEDDDDDDDDSEEIEGIKPGVDEDDDDDF